MPIGAEAVFRCQHQTADIIRSRVNDTLVGRNTPPDIRQTSTFDEGDVVGTLTVMGRPEYNGTMVVCVAKLINERSDEQTEPAMLTGSTVTVFLITLCYRI